MARTYYSPAKMASGAREPPAQACVRVAEHGTHAFHPPLKNSRGRLRSIAAGSDSECGGSHGRRRNARHRRRKRPFGPARRADPENAHVASTSLPTARDRAGSSSGAGFGDVARRGQGRHIFFALEPEKYLPVSEPDGRIVEGDSKSIMVGKIKESRDGRKKVAKGNVVKD